jgi:hypothetical protein
MSQIWIDPPKGDGSIVLHVWEFKNSAIDLLSFDGHDFQRLLDEALRISKSFE